MNTLTITFSPCSPAPANGYKISYRPTGSAIAYRVAPSNFISSPAVIVDANDPDGTQYEGFIETDCGGAVIGVPVPFTTSGGGCANVTSLQLVSVNENSATVNFNTNPNASGYSIYAVKVSDSSVLPTITALNPPVVYSGLDGSTIYNIFVKTNCNGGGTSSGVSVQATTTESSPYWVEITQSKQSYSEDIICDCGENPVPYDVILDTLSFRVKNAANQYVASLPVGVTISGSYRIVGTDGYNPVNQIKSFSFAGAVVSKNQIVRHLRTFCDDAYQSCLDFQFVTVDEEYVVRDFTGNVPVKASLFVYNWSNASAGVYGFDPSQTSIGLQDLRNLSNIELWSLFFDNIIQYTAAAPELVVFTSKKDQFFAPTPAGAAFFTDQLLTTPLLGVSNISIYIIDGNTNLYIWESVSLNPATGISV